MLNKAAQADFYNWLKAEILTSSQLVYFGGMEFCDLFILTATP